MTEREIKLAYESVVLARAAVAAMGASPLRGRRLQDDRLLDWPDGRLGQRRCTVRVRDDGGRAFVTFKGAPQPDMMKVREELETAVDDAAVALDILHRLGLEVWFRYQKYREEYRWRDVTVTIDETPIGAFVELEGGRQGITELAAAMGRSTEDYVRASYRELFEAARTTGQVTGAHMLFDPEP